MRALHLIAPAKLNLVLRITGRRADGYHLLETLFHAIDLADELWLMPAAGLEVALTVTAERGRAAVAGGPDNLVVRALQRLCAAAGVEVGMRVHLHKRVPAGGGLGGGSSDAAAALRGGNLLLPEPLPDPVLHRIATGLGADCAFFLAGGSQWGRGIGDELEPVELPPLWFVLLIPPFDCPTADVYKNYAAHWRDGRAQGTTRSVPFPSTWDSALRTGFSNDLERAAEAVRPELGALRQRVADLGSSSVVLTGSGSTLFVPHATRAAAEACAAALTPLTRDGVEVLVAGSAGRSPAAVWERWPDPVVPPGVPNGGRGG